MLLVTPTTLSMTWSPPPISSRNGVISHYLVRVTSSTSGSRTITTANTYLQTLVRLNANYSVQVAAINSAGNGLYSQARFIKTPILGKRIIECRFFGTFFIVCLLLAYFFVCLFFVYLIFFSLQLLLLLLPI